MKLICLTIVLFASLTGHGQSDKKQFISIAVTSSNTAYPLTKFAGLFTKVHPGFQLAWRINWEDKKHHEWYQTIETGYFFHRFVQHGINLHTSLGYDYKFSAQWKLGASLGAGYFHSIPATAVLKLDENGNYKNGKGAGRSQAMLAFAIASHYRLSERNAILINYQQRLQMPFIKSYVLLLPYNMISIGFQKRIRN